MIKKFKLKSFQDNPEKNIKLKKLRSYYSNKPRKIKGEKKDKGIKMDNIKTFIIKKDIPKE